MKYYLNLFLALVFALALSSCGNDAEPFIADQPPVNPEDSVIMMELYSTFRIQEAGNPNYVWIARHPDFWKGIEFEYDETTGYRYVCGITMYGDPDHIPSSIGKLSHLRQLNLDGIPNSEVLIPKEIFNCPLESLTLYGKTEWRMDDQSQELVTLPAEIGKVKDTLKSIRIYQTALSELPQEFSQLVNLECCFLGMNRLRGKVPDYFGDFKCDVTLSYNNFTEYNWDLLPQGKNIPMCHDNNICNPVPEEIVREYRDEIWRHFLANYGNYELRCMVSSIE